MPQTPLQRACEGDGVLPVFLAFAEAVHRAVGTVQAVFCPHPLLPVLLKLGCLLFKWTFLFP